MKFTAFTITLIFIVLKFDAAAQDTDSIRQFQALRYAERGKAFLDSTLFDSAIANYEKSSELYLQLRIWDKHLDAINWLGYIWIEKKNNLARSRDYCDYAIKTGIAQFGEQCEQVADAYHNYAIIYMHYAGSYQIAIGYLTKALEIRKAVLGEEHWKVARSYMVIGNNYTSVNPYLCSQFHHKSLYLNKKLFGENSIQYAEALGDFGLNIHGQPDSSEFYLRKAIAIYEQNHFSEKSNLIQYYKILGQLYYAQVKYSEFDVMLEKAIPLAEQFYSNNSYTLFDLLVQAGDMYKAMGNLSKANICYSKKNLYEKFGNDPDTTIVLKASDFVEFNYIPGIRPWNDYWYNEYLKNSNAQLLIHALNFSLWRDSVATLTQQKKLCFFEKALSKNNTTINWQNSTSTIVSYTMGQLAKTKSKKNEYKNLCFYFSDVNKGLAQFDFLSKKVQIKKLLNDSLRKLYFDARDAIFTATLGNALYLDDNQQASNNLKIHQAYKEIQAYDSLLIAGGYQPEKQLFNYDIAEDIQKKLDSKTALLSYLITDSLLYVFTLTKSDFLIDTIHINKKDFISDIRNLVNKVISRSFDIEGYANNANSIYKKLFPNELPANIKNLIIIPDDALSYLPFECLVTKPVNHAQSFSELPFLLKKFNIRYCNSARLFLLLQDINDEQSGGFAGFAPIFKNQNLAKPTYSMRQLFSKVDSFIVDSLALTQRLLTHTGVSALPDNRREVETIGQLSEKRNLPTSLLLNEQANENEIKKTNLKNFDYIHFATHGFTNPETPELCGLVLAQDTACTDSINNDGVLFFNELFSLDLDARLVTLSACETGIGRYYRGEGNVSLSSALIQAGAQNVMNTLWKVSDNSTADLMIAFYSDFLKRNHNPNYAESLRKAKLKIMKNSQFSHPFFWAGFVLNGK